MNFERDIVFDVHAIGRDIAPVAIEIALAHIERVEPELDGDRIHHALAEHHALRTAEAAERGIGNRMGHQSPRPDAHARIKIGVVGMEHRAVIDALRQIRRIAAARQELDIDGSRAGRSCRNRRCN